MWRVQRFRFIGSEFRVQRFRVQRLRIQTFRVYCSICDEPIVNDSFDTPLANAPHELMPNVTV